MTVVLFAWVSWTVTRLDRLHGRTALARSALDAALVRRAAALQALASHPDTALGPQREARLLELAAASLDADDEHPRGRRERPVPGAAGHPGRRRPGAAGRPHRRRPPGGAGPPVLQRRGPRHRVAAPRAGCRGCSASAGAEPLPAFFEIDDTIPVPDAAADPQRVGSRLRQEVSVRRFGLGLHRAGPGSAGCSSGSRPGRGAEPDDGEPDAEPDPVAHPVADADERRSRKPKPAVNPLTGLRGVPTQPVVAVKIDDTANGRPQIGLESADVVYVEQVEAGADPAGRGLRQPAAGAWSARSAASATPTPSCWPRTAARRWRTPAAPAAPVGRLRRSPVVDAGPQRRRRGVPAAGQPGTRRTTWWWTPAGSPPRLRGRVSAPATSACAGPATDPRLAAGPPGQRGLGRWSGRPGCASAGRPRPAAGCCSTATARCRRTASGRADHHAEPGRPVQPRPRRPQRRRRARQPVRLHLDGRHRHGCWSSGTAGC